MNALVFYWVLTLIVLIILTMLTDVGTAAILTTFIIVIRFMSQECYSMPKDSVSKDSVSKDSVSKDSVQGFEAKLSPSPKLPILKPDIIIENSEMVDNILYPKTYSADDRIFDSSIVSGLKEKKAKDIRSHWNNKNSRKYFDYELGIHENREWWTDDDFELSKKHIVI